MHIMNRGFANLYTQVSMSKKQIYKTVQMCPQQLNSVKSSLKINKCQHVGLHS